MATPVAQPEATKPPPTAAAISGKGTSFSATLVAPGAQLVGAHYPNPVDPGGWMRSRSLIADADGTTQMKPRKFGLPRGYPAQETMALPTAGKQMWKDGWKVQSGPAPPWDRAVLLPPPSTLEGPPTTEEFDAMRYAGRAPAPRMWDGAAMGSIRGLRGKSSRRDSSRLFGDYMRNQAGAGFVPGLETPPPNMKRAWSAGEVRAPEVSYDTVSLNREGLLKWFSNDLSTEALKKGLKWSLRVPLVNAYASAISEIDDHFTNEQKMAREKLRYSNGDLRPVFQHFYYPHGRAEDLDDPSIQEQLEIEDLLEQLRLERLMVLRWVRSFQSWAGKGVSEPRDFGVGTPAWVLRRWKADYCASEAWALDLIAERGWWQIIPAGWKDKEKALLEEAQAEALARQRALPVLPATGVCPADPASAPERKDSYFETLHVQNHRHLFTRLQELQLPEEAVQDLERDLAPLNDVRAELGPNATARTAASVAAAAAEAGYVRDLEAGGTVECRDEVGRDDESYCKWVGVCGQCTHPKNFLYNLRTCEECEATKLQLENSRWEHALEEADQRWHRAFVREEMAPYSWLGWAHRKFKDEFCNRGSAWALRQLANEQRFMATLQKGQQAAFLDVDGNPPVQAFLNALLTASARERLKGGFFSELLGGKGAGLLQDRSSEGVQDEVKCYPAEMVQENEKKRKQIVLKNRDMLRKHYYNHAAEVVKVAPPLRQRHFEWAKLDFIPTALMYHHTRNPLAYRGAANDAVRYGPNSYRQWLAQPVKVPVRRRNKDGTPMLQFYEASEGENEVKYVVRDELSGLCAPGHARGRTGPGGEAPEADYCLPRFQYDLVEVYSPTLVDELLQDERNKALADVSWWFKKELTRLTLELADDTNRPYYRGEQIADDDPALGGGSELAKDSKLPEIAGDGKSKLDKHKLDEEEKEPNPFEDVTNKHNLDKKDKFDPIAPRMYPMERRGYSIFGGVFRKKEDEASTAERPLPQISDSLWPKYGTYKWGPLGKLGASDVGDHTVLEGEMSQQAPTYDSRGHVVPIDTRRQRVTAVTTMWDTVPTNRMPHVPYPRMRWPQARVFESPHLMKGAPWKSDRPLMTRAKAQMFRMSDQRAAADAASEELPVPTDPQTRDRIFANWHTTHQGGTST